MFLEKTEKNVGYDAKMEVHCSKDNALDDDKLDKGKLFFLSGTVLKRQKLEPLILYCCDRFSTLFLYYAIDKASIKISIYR